MRRRLISFFRHPRLKRVLLVGVILASVGALLLISLLALLPTILSTSAVQTRLKTSLSTSLKHSVTWSSLVMTWSEGLTLKGFCLGDGPAPLRSACIDEIVLVPDFDRGAGGFGLDLALQVRNLRAELAPAPPPDQTQTPAVVTPPPPTPPAKDPLTALAEAVQQVETLDWPLPLDLRVKVEVAPIAVVYRDLAAQREVTLADGAFHLGMSSLATRPLETTFSGRVLLDGRELGPVRLRAQISQLVTPEQRLHPAAVLLDVELKAPGTTLTAQGGLTQSDGLTLRTQLDLPALVALGQPFLSPTLPIPAGKLDFKLDARFDAARDLHVAMALDGKGLAASGGALQKRRLGPLDLRLRQKLVTDHLRQVVDFPEGSLILPGLLDVVWSATIEQPTGPERIVKLRCGPLRLDLEKGLAVAKPLLPPDLPVQELKGELLIRNLGAELHGPENRGTVTIEGAGVVLPRLRLALTDGTLVGEGLQLNLDRAELPLVALLPTAVTADLSWGARQLKLSGAQPVVAEGLAGKLWLAVTELDLKSPSPYKVAAKAELTQSFDLERVTIGSALNVEQLHQQLRLLAQADPSGALSATLPELKLAVAKGELLQLQAKAGLSAAPQFATTEGTARLDLGRLMPLAASFLPAGFAADGMVTTTWNVAAPLPQGALPAESNPLRLARASLAQIDRAALTLQLDRLNLRVPSATGPIAITGLQTAPLLRIALTDRGQAIRIAGGLQLGGVSGLSGAAGQLAPQHATLNFDGELLHWNLLRLTEELHIEPLGLSQVAEVTIDRIEPLLTESGPLTPALLLKRLDATLFVDVDAKLPRALTPLVPGIALCGRANAGTRIDLSAGKELRVRAYAGSRDFGVKLGETVQVEGVRSDLVLERRLALVASRSDGVWVPLSAGLVRPAVLTTTSVGGSEIAGRVRDDLRGAVSGPRTFTVTSAALKANNLPMTLTALEGDLRFAPEELGLSFFQTELLGGSLRTRGVVDLRPDVPLLVVTCDFSHLDSTQLLPLTLRETSRKAQPESELTGEFALSAPLATESRPLLEGVRLQLNLRKIGSRTLERALFSLDPYERNEQLVEQRKLLRHGGLKGLRVNVLDGALSLEGEVQVGGVALALPKVERLRLSELPIRKTLGEALVMIATLRQGLELARADLLLVDPNGTLSLKRSSDVE